MAITTQTFTSGSHVDTWNAIVPATAISGCSAQPSVALSGSHWTNPHKAFVANGAAFRSWTSGIFYEDWINAWPSTQPWGTGGVPEWWGLTAAWGGPASTIHGQSWTRYSTPVSGTGTFDLYLAADNCSWIYITDSDGSNAKLVGVQLGAPWVVNIKYPVTLNGDHKLEFIVLDLGGQSGGMFRLETSTTVYIDTDGDGLADVTETNVTLTDPNNADTDGDGVNDLLDAYPLDPTRTSLDNSPPSVTPLVTGTLGDNGWYTSDVSVSWTATDGESTVTSKPCAASNVTADTPTATFTCTATSSGGTATGSVTLKRDATAPTISAAISAGTAGNNGWYTSPVTVHFTCADGGSGVVSCPSDQTLSNQGANTSAAGTATDAAGNTSGPSNTVSANIDGVKPVIAFGGNLGSYSVDQQVNISCSADDVTSGIAASTCPGATGDAYAFGVGAHTLNASATDKAGNQHAASTSFTVTVNSGNICELVKRWVSNAGVANSMCVKLRQGSYGAFRNELSAQSDKKFLSAAHAAILLQLVNLLN
ncbi:MAG: hypothetical protein WC700_12450 [Gemmatimonadaceae bacterium]